MSVNVQIVQADHSLQDSPRQPPAIAQAAHNTSEETLEADDGSSSLSDLADGAGNEEPHRDPADSKDAPEEMDTEAETERLEDSPQKIRNFHKNVIVKSNAQTAMIRPKAPINDRNPANVPVKVSLYENGLSSHLPIENYAESHGLSKSSPITDTILNDMDDGSDVSSIGSSPTEMSRKLSPSSIIGKKRKRSSPIETQRASSVVVEEASIYHALPSTDPANAPHLYQSTKAVETELSNEKVRDAVQVNNGVSNMDIEDVEPEQLSPSRIPKTRKGKRKSKKPKADEPVISPDSGIVVSLEEEDVVAKRNRAQTLASCEEEADLEDNPEDVGDDIVTKNEEDLARKKTAIDALGSIEKAFITFRDKLYDERLAQLNEELTLLTQPVIEHPEYLAMCRCIDERRDEKVQYEYIKLRYELETLERCSIAEKSQHHGQYMQTARAIRERYLEHVCEQYAQVQREWRSWEGTVPDYTYLYDPHRPQQIIYQTAYNAEVSLLAGIARNVGFPAAPELSVHQSAEIDEDFQNMGIKEQVHAHVTHQGNTATSRIAQSYSPFLRHPEVEEQFIERNAWANPRHPAHQQHQHQQRPGPWRQNFITPAPQRRIVNLGAPTGSASTNAEIGSGQNSSIARVPSHEVAQQSSSKTTSHAETNVTFSPSMRRWAPVRDDPTAKLSISTPKFSHLADSPLPASDNIRHRASTDHPASRTHHSSPTYNHRSPQDAQDRQRARYHSVPRNVDPPPIGHPVVKAEDPIDLPRSSPVPSHFQAPQRNGMTTGLQMGRVKNY